jgi:general L-amino acid transport system substrate-binding protein
LQRGAAQNLVNANQEVQALFGRAGRSGEVLGLDSDWGARVLRQVGNYREVWERNIGPLGVQRGLNLLWNQGGLQYAPPLR